MGGPAGATALRELERPPVQPASAEQGQRRAPSVAAERASVTHKQC